MNQLVPQLERECRASWIPLVRPGDPRNVILDVIAAGDIDLVALGTHGRAGVARLFLGSVAERVLAAARCDVLVVRPPREEGSDTPSVKQGRSPSAEAGLSDA